MTNKLRYILLLITSTALLMSGCDSFDANGPEIKDNIESISKWNVNLSNSENSNLVSFKKFDISGKLLLHLEYHKSGLLASRAEYSYENNLSYEVITYFDEFGEKLETTNCNYTYLNDKIIEKKLTDTVGNVLKVIEYDYNHEGRLIKSTETDISTGSSTSTIYNYQFNQSGNLIERISMTAEGNISGRDSLNYVGNSNSVEVVNFNSSGSISIVYTYIYDFRGNILSESQSNSSGELLKKYVYEYTFY